MSARSAAMIAIWNALRIIWGGMIAFGLYLLFVTVGPSIEGKLFPVIKDYQLSDINKLENGGLAFNPTFDKVRDCTYYGVTWFSPDEKGNLSRIQTQRTGDYTTATAPQTGPLGHRSGNTQIIVPPEGASQIFGIMHHDCGLLWQTRTTVGPFSLETGRVDKPIRPAGS